MIHALRDQGNTMVVIEHNLDVIKTADWVIDLGPEGGAGGGELLVEGTPEQVAAEPRSHTGQHLARLLARHAEGDAQPPDGRRAGRKGADAQGAGTRRAGAQAPDAQRPDAAPARRRGPTRRDA